MREREREGGRSSLTVSDDQIAASESDRIAASESDWITASKSDRGKRECLLV